MTKPDKKIGFIGLGKMGSGICRNIQKAGFPLSVYNRTKSKMKPFVDAGAYEAQSPKEVASRSDIVLTSLMDDQSVLDTVLGENGIFAGLKPGQVHIGLTTITVKTAEKLEKLHKEKGFVYLAGPVLGRPDVAEEGQLRTFMSGDSAAIESCEEVVKSYTSAIVKVGDTASAGTSMKICANYIAITQIEMMGEIYAFAEKSGLNLDLMQIVFQGLFTEPTIQMYAAKIRNRQFDDGGFELLGGLKDVLIYEEAFTNMGVIPGIAKVVKDKLVTAAARGMGKKDWSATYEITRLMAGLD